MLFRSFGISGENDYIKQLHNACEDAWIEHTGIDANLTGNIDGLLTALLDQIVGEANVTVSDWTDPRQYPFIFAVYLRRHLNCYVPVPEGLAPIIHKASEMILDCKSSADTLRVARWIMAQLRGQTSPDVNQIIGLIASCIKTIWKDEDMYAALDYSSAELIEFVENLSPANFEKLEQFFLTMPKLRHEVKFKCSKCEADNTAVMEGLQSFFG